MLFLLATPLLAIFTNHQLGLTLGFLWGFIAWCVVIGQWQLKEGPVFSIKNDTVLQQHNKEAEEMEKEEMAVPPPPQDPQQVVKDVMESATKSEIKHNPFQRRRIP